MGAHLRIAIADDHALFREGLKALLSLRPEIVVVAETDRADAVVPMVTGTPCDVLLLDLQMDRTSLIDVETAARSAKVIIVTASERGDDALAAVRAGASGVVFKRFAVETLVDALGAVAAGQVWVPPALQTGSWPSSASRLPSRSRRASARSYGMSPSAFAMPRSARSSSSARTRSRRI